MDQETAPHSPIKNESTLKGRVTKIPGTNEKLNYVLVEEDHTDNPVNTQLLTGCIIKIIEIDPYMACPTFGCNDEALITIKPKDTYIMMCQNCSGLFGGSTANVYMRAEVLLATETSQKKVTIFAPQIQKLLQYRGCDPTITLDSKEMMDKLFSIIPCQIKYSLINNTLREVNSV